MDCRVCGERIITSGRGPVPRFCSTRCRVRNHRAVKAAPFEAPGLQSRWVRADSKRPIQVDGKMASSTDPRTWASYADVSKSKAGNGYGVMLGDGLGCYDLDDMRDQQARDFIATIPETIIFAERSVSGTGVHVFVETAEGSGYRRGAVEFYSWGRFIRMTGQRFH